MIRPSTSVLVPCVDYQKLNKLARFNAYSVPSIEEVIDTMGPARVISTLPLI